MPELRDYLCEPAEYGLDELFAMPYEKAVMTGCIPDAELDEALGIAGARGILLTGSQGSGKETLCMGLSHSLVSCGYTFFRVPGRHLVSSPQLCGQLENLLSMEQEEGVSGIYLYLDDLLPLSEQIEICENLGYVLRRLLAEAKHLVITATVTSKEDIPLCLTKPLMECRVLPPTVVELRILLERAFEQRVFLARNCSLHTLAEMCEGFTYGKMKDVITYTCMLLKDKAIQLYGTNRKLMLQSLKNGQVVLTEDMFRDVVEHLEKPVTAPVMAWAAEPGGNGIPVAPMEEPTVEPNTEIGLMDIPVINIDDL